MYEAHFGLNARPFASVPCVDQYYPAESMEAARTTLVRCLRRGEGAGMIVGPSGTGKTLLCQLLAAHLRAEYAVALLHGGGLGNRRALLQAILYELGRPYRGMDEGELRLALLDYLTNNEDRPEAMILLVDEAHTLPLRLLDEIRMITNWAADGQPAVRLVLAGSPLLEERMAHPKLESFSQRMVARCYLEPFGRAETEQYIQARTSAAGLAAAAVFCPEACQAVHKAVDGVPRLINQLCDHALLLAYADGRTQISKDVVEEAWSDLQQLPTPWSGELPATRQAGVVEFGQLEEETAPEPARDMEQKTSDPGASREAALEPDELLPDPVARLEQIEETLAALDEDFQPAGTIGPEVELVFDECINPFSEPFEEEIPVVDPYRSASNRGTDKRPVLRLEPIPQQSLPPRVLDPSPGVVPADSWGFPGEDPYGEPAPPAEEPVPAVCTSQQDVAGFADLPEPEVHAEETAFEQSSDAGPAEPPADWEDEPETVLLRRGQSVSEQDSSGADGPEMIVVEDGYEPLEAPHCRRAAVVRRQEYAQLFTRLRKSS